MSPARRARTHATVTDGHRPRWAGDLDAVIDELAVHAHAGAVAGTAAAAVEHGRARRRAAPRGPTPRRTPPRTCDRALDALDVGAPGDGATRLELLTDLGTARAAAGDAMAGRRALVAAARLADDRARRRRRRSRAVRHVNGDDLWSGLDWSEVDDATIGVLRAGARPARTRPAGRRAPSCWPRCPRSCTRSTDPARSRLAARGGRPRRARRRPAARGPRPAAPVLGSVAPGRSAGARRSR